MPSEDAKSVKREAVKEEEEAEDRSLSSILQARKKNPTNAGTLAAKSRSKDAKIKKEEDEDDKDEDFNIPIKGKGSSGSRSKPRSEKFRKEKDVSDDEDDDDQPLSKRSVSNKNTKELNKKKSPKVEAKKVSVPTKQNDKVNGKREKKVYDLPGQKRDTPEERDPLRIFYETLYKQVPSSEMAQIWMMESGLLPQQEAKKVYEKKQKKSQNKLTSPLKPVTPLKRAKTGNIRKMTETSSISQKKKATGTSKDSSKQSKKRKIGDGSSEDDSDNDFLVNISAKRQKAS